ncbi:MAG: 5'/3'-nucleotidase SurE [Flavobacteriales bacterium]|jgi:5'-nucleotidase
MNSPQNRPLILVTNDDGVFSKGILALTEAVLPFGDVVVVAPDKPQSGMGHAVTINNILKLHPVKYDLPVSAAYSCSGTPVDCVKLAIYKVMHRKPDLVVSGINHGSNSSINVIYSGTMSAAMEGAVEGIPSIGFSLLDHSADADFEASQEVVKKLVEAALTKGIPDGVCLNVNIPKGIPSSIAGIRICHQAKGYWEDNFDVRTDPYGKPYYWLTGEFKLMDEGLDTDEIALAAGYVSVVPVHFDLTAYRAMQQLKEWNL